MKICLVNATAYPTIGGVENSLRYMACELKRIGHDVKIIAFRFRQDDPRRVIHDGVEILRYDCHAERWPHRQQYSRVKAMQKGFQELSTTYQPDAIWCRDAPAGLGIRRAGYRGPLLQIFPTNARMNCRGRFLYTKGLSLRRRAKLLGLYPFCYYAMRQVERELARLCIPVTFSDNMRQCLLKDLPGGIPCHVVPPGVDTNVFSAENGKQYWKRIEKEYGLRRDSPIVLYIGRLSCAKHIPMLMDAVAHLHDNVRLVIVGGGPEEKRLSDYARRIGIARRTVFAGDHSKLLAGFYSISRVTVLPTTIESFGQVYLESMACETPVVGFAGNGRNILTATEEIVQDGKTGAIARSVSSTALAEKINQILDLESESYAEMARDGLANVRRRYTWPLFVEKALQLTLK
jgi:1,2-diacylglycerol 3-alpha-glucosyltransferase